MNTLATITWDPRGIIAWLVVGLLAGWLAGKLMKGAEYGLVGDIIVGLVGSVIGGFLFGLVVDGDPAFWGSVTVAFLGAGILIVSVRIWAIQRGEL
jgi:uncharacterized membrane protein YeaQ/YmgE (transglycosylase-associated protein family)